MSVCLFKPDIMAPLYRPSGNFTRNY